VYLPLFFIFTENGKIEKWNMNMEYMNIDCLFSPTMENEK